MTFIFIFYDMILLMRLAKGLLCTRINGYKCNDVHVKKLSKFNHYALFASH